MKTKINILLFLSLLTVGIIVFSCEKKKDNELSKKEKIKSEHLQNITKGIQEQLKESENNFKELLEKVTVFENDTDMKNLENVKTAFKKSLVSWKRCQIYNVRYTQRKFLFHSIDHWPSAKPNQIEAKINTNEQINQEYVKKQGSYLISMAGVEYLLYEFDTLETLNKFQQDPRRLSYLKACCQEFITETQKIEKAWEQYSKNFIDINTKKGGIEDSYNISLNAMVSTLAIIKITKLEKPRDQGRYDKLEAYRSQLSLECIKSNIESVDMMFNGTYPNVENKIGFDDYLSALGKKELVSNINIAIEKVQKTIDSLIKEKKSLRYLIENDKSKVKELQDEIRELLYLFEVKMKSAIGAIITPSGADGD